MKAKKIQDVEDRKREPEEMSTIGLDIDPNERITSQKQIKKLRKQQDMSANIIKFGKQRLGVHG